MLNASEKFSQRAVGNNLLILLNVPAGLQMSQSQVGEIINGFNVLLKQFSQGIGIKSFICEYFMRYPQHKFDEAYLQKILKQTEGTLMRMYIVNNVTIIFPLLQEHLPAILDIEILELYPASVPNANCFFVRRDNWSRKLARISAELGTFYKKSNTATADSDARPHSMRLQSDESSPLSTSPKFTLSFINMLCDMPKVGEYYALYDEEMHRYWRVRVNVSLTNFVEFTYIDLGNFGEMKWPRLLKLPARWNPKNFVDGHDNMPAMTLYMIDHNHKPFGFPRSRRALQIVLTGKDSPEISIDEDANVKPVKASVVHDHSDSGIHLVRLLAPDESDEPTATNASKNTTDSENNALGLFEWTLAKMPELFAIDKFYSDAGDPDCEEGVFPSNVDKRNILNFFADRLSGISESSGDEAVKTDEMAAADESEAVRLARWKEWAECHNITIDQTE